MKYLILISLIFSYQFILDNPAFAAEVNVKIYRIDKKGIHEKLGSISLIETQSGIKLIAQLEGFKEGKHAFHIHQNPSCKPGLSKGKLIAGLLAGGHYMRDSKHHSNHQHHDKPHGDLPELEANHQGRIDTIIIVKHLILAEIINRSIIIHDRGEYEKGRKIGGGERFACGVISK